MKVLMVVGQFYPMAGGTEKECQKLAAGMLKRGVQVTVLTQYCAGLPDHEVIEGITVYRKMRGWHLYEYTYMLSVLWFLLRKVKDYDIIQCFGIYLFIPPVVLVKYLFKKKVIGRVEGSGVYGDFHRIKQLRCGWLILRSARKLDFIISIAGHIGREILDHNFSRETVVSIPNSVDGEVYRPGDDSGSKIRETMCFVGRLAEEKGLSYLMNAMKLVKTERTGVQLIIVGDGELRGALEKLRDTLSLQDEVFFAGNDNTLPHYQNAGLFVLPSLSEGLSLSLLEAMACGLPVIASDAGGNREVIDPHGAAAAIPLSHYHIGEYGILVNPGDVGGLARAVVRMFKDTELSKNLQRRAREHVEKVYALDKIIDDYLSLYLLQ